MTLLLCGSRLATPTYAWFNSSRASSGSTIISGQYTIRMTDQEQNTVDKTVNLDLSQDNLHIFYITADGSASTGYCIVTVQAENAEQETYCISPIPKGETVALILQAAAGTEVAFESSWGKPPENAQILTPAASFDLRNPGPATVALEISQTPYLEYTVPEGAVLEAIAQHYGVSARDILTFNGLEVLTPGETIRIPYVTEESAPEPYEPNKAQFHVVVEGDTLQTIADAYHVPLYALCQWNGIDVTTEIWPGMELEIPIMAPLPEATEPEATEPEATEPEATEPEATEPEATEPEATEPEATEPEATEPEATEPEATEPDNRPSYLINDVPLYFQNDYPDVMYGSGTVATSGCSVTCLAMVSSAMTDYDYNPAELAEYFGGRAENNIERLEMGSDALGLAWEKSPNWDITWQALLDGKMAIVLMEGDSLFTETQHFIVLTGLNEEGLIMVNDPANYNYTNWQLQRGFVEGFTPNDMLKGYSGAWIYDPAAMPEEGAPRYEEKHLEKTPENSRYPDIQLTAEERELLARMIWVEARGEIAEGQQAVAEVVFNRMMSDQFPDTLKGVIYAEGQFESVPLLEEAEPYQAQYQAIDRALYGESVLPTDVFYFARDPKTDDVYGMIGHHIFCR